MIAGFFYSLTFQFPETATQDVGPAFMPRVYCGLIVLLGGLLIIQGFRDQSKKKGQSARSVMHWPQWDLFCSILF